MTDQHPPIVPLPEPSNDDTDLSPQLQWPTDEPLGDLIDKWVQEAFSKKPHGCKHPTHVYVACKAYECGRSHAARTAQAQPEPQGPPKNCWIDDEPDFYPSPCVFDDPSEVIDNCIYAQRVKCKTDCKYYRADVQPEPQRPTDEELDLVVIAIQALTPHQPDATTHDLDAIDRGREILKERLACWGQDQQNKEAIND